MAETLAIAHPLALAPEQRGPDSTAVVLTAGPALTLFDLRCRDRAALDSFLHEPAGLASPPVGRSAVNDGAILQHFGPDWWQLRCCDGALAGRVRAAGAADGAVAVTDLSDAFVVIGVAGPRARHVLAKAATVDLHAGSFPPGTVARTLFGRQTVVIARPEPGEPAAFELTVARSGARFLWRWLADAAQEYGYTLKPFAGAPD